MTEIFSVPPSRPRILGDRGKQLSDSVSVGPFKEGDPLTIQCVAVGGEPPPSVLWYRDNTIIDKTYIANEKGAVQNTLTIQRLDRSDMGPRYRCLASNNNMTLPTQTWITLDIMCKFSVLIKLFILPFTVPILPCGVWWCLMS